MLRKPTTLQSLFSFMLHYAIVLVVISIRKEEKERIFIRKGLGWRSAAHRFVSLPRHQLIKSTPGFFPTALAFRAAASVAGCVGSVVTIARNLQSLGQAFSSGLQAIRARFVCHSTAFFGLRTCAWSTHFLGAKPAVSPTVLSWNVFAHDVSCIRRVFKPALYF